MLEKHELTPELSLFFEKLLSIKNFVKETSEKSKDAMLKTTLDVIYIKLHEIIKAANE